MIYTVTFNPSLDYVVRVNEFELGHLHRTLKEDLFVGGKGINVSTVLKTLGVPSMALGFVAGFTGKEIIHRLSEMGISSDFVILSQGISRINVKLKSLKSGRKEETEINGQGPIITQEELTKFYDKLEKLKKGDILVLSGSVPNSMQHAEMVYKTIGTLVKERDVRLVVDAEGELLRQTLSLNPFLIKPNKTELEKLFNRKLKSHESVLECAKLLQKAGAKNVLVSLGEEGALLLDEFRKVYNQPTVQGEVQNSVGSGDSMVAGFLAQFSTDITVYGRKDKKLYENALKLGIAAGSAAAFTIGLPEKERIDEIFRQLSMTQHKVNISR